MSALLDAVLESPSHELRPERALVFYTRGSALELVTVHSVRSGRGAPALGPGQPLSPEEEMKVVQLLHSADTAPAAVQVFPEGLLALDRYQMVWWVPPGERPMHFSTGKGTEVRLVRWPGLVLRVFNQTLYVMAVTGDARPAADTPLVKAPVGNVWVNGEVCTGSAVLPQAAQVADIPGWNAVVFDSAFSHANDRDVVRVKGKPKDPLDFWLADGATFEPRNAVPTDMTLGQWLAQSPDENRY